MGQSPTVFLQAPHKQASLSPTRRTSAFMMPDSETPGAELVEVCATLPVAASRNRNILRDVAWWLQP